MQRLKLALRIFLDDERLLDLLFLVEIPNIRVVDIDPPEYLEGGDHPALFLGLGPVALLNGGLDALEGEVNLRGDLVEILLLLFLEGELPVHLLAEVGEF